jgi:carbonic anhydrase/acetyltransferase-like protein (isoleucine patch superfamily)
MESWLLDATKICGAGLKNLIAYQERIPNLHPSVFVAEGAKIIGDVEIEENSSIWFNTVVRGDVHRIRIGSHTNVQDNSVLHVTSKTAPLLIGSNVTIGHSVVLHGCTIEENCLIGMGSVVLDGAYIHRNSIVAAGSLVLEGFDIPEGLLVAGVPAKVKRPLTNEEKRAIQQSADNYVLYCQTYRLS